MKQNITLALDQEILLAARIFAPKKCPSASAMLAEGMREKIGKERLYEHSKQIVLAMLDQSCPLGGHGMKDREALHDRISLR